MRNLYKKAAILAAAATIWTAGPALAGPPFNNLEGVGGVAFNPLAYTAGTAQESKEGAAAVVAKPQFGAWYVNLNDSDIDWTTIGVADTLFKRLELSYGFETVAIGAAPGNTHKNNLGAKLLLVEEGGYGIAALPAVSVGAIAKRTTFDGPAGTDANGIDYYAVATKLVKALPVPVLLSGGVRSTKEIVTGVVGFDKDRDLTFFGNVDAVLDSQFVLGFEYKQGARFDDVKNADYWDAHAAWLASKNLTLIAAYADTGDRKSATKAGFGGGTVLSAQYAF